MPQAFVVMQIGNAQLDRLYSGAIVPAVRACGLDEKRVDKHNEGGLLKSEIIRFIETSDIVVADLTNERPNCYLEVGYAMGIGKFKRLILTARIDHNLDSTEHPKGGPKVHFDLAGYDILFWDPNRIDAFQAELETRIRRRMAVISSPSPTSGPWDQQWIDSHREVALQGLNNAGRSGYVETHFALRPPKIRTNQRILDEAARDAPIHTFGWPIGVYMTNVQQYRPRPTAEGIVAEISVRDSGSYDYWSLRTNGDFYLLSSLFEDERDTNKIFFNTRVVRTTETLLYCARLYERLSVDDSSTVYVAVKYGGLRNRTISATNPMWSLPTRRPSADDVVQAEITCTLSDLESNLVGHTKELVAPLLIMFDFFELDDSSYQRIVDNFVKGKVI